MVLFAAMHESEDGTRQRDWRIDKCHMAAAVSRLTCSELRESFRRH